MYVSLESTVTWSLVCDTSVCPACRAPLWDVIKRTADMQVTQAPLPFQFMPQSFPLQSHISDTSECCEGMVLRPQFPAQ